MAPVIDDAKPAGEAIGMTEERRIGPYRIFEALGRGGMGVVYRARHVTSERPVALKTVQAAGHFTLDGLRREITALTTIRHPGVVRIVDHGVHEGLPWYAMDLLEGESLRRFGQRLWSRYRSPRCGESPVPITATDALSGVAVTQRSEPLPVAPVAGEVVTNGELPPVAAGELDRVLGLGRRLCLTLAFLHGEGFVNCDFKPENVLLVNGAPVLIDFGLTAHQPGGSGRELLDAQRAMIGTLQYMAPEQMRGEILDARSDLYALGCVLYELVAGRPPFLGSPPALMSQHLSAPPPPPSTLVQGLPPELERVILRLLAKEPAHRFGYADEVATVLAELAASSPRLSDYPPARAYLYRPGFVGRDLILRRLVELRERAADGAGACVLIGGESGIGKTRLALELTRLPASTRMRVVTSDVPAPSMTGSAASGSPLQALRSLLVALADACQEGGPEATSRLLGERRGLLAPYEPLLAQVPATAPLLPPAPLPPDAARQRLFRALWDAIAALTEVQPLLWVIDDLGWADELSLSFLATLTEDFLARHPLFIVGTYRSEEPSDAVATLGALPHVTHLVLPRLDSDEVSSMVRDMLALTEPAPDFLAFVTQQTEGNPFFVAEYLRSAVTDRVLYRDGDVWRLPGQLAGGTQVFRSLALPQTLRELVERRLRSLSPAATQVVVAASVLGREADVGLLREVVAVPEGTFVSAWDDLLRRQVLEEPRPGRVRFAHDKLREAAHAQAPAERLRELHLRAGEVLERRANDAAVGEASWASLGHHFAAAQQADKAARYLQLAAEHAQRTYANQQAVQLYRAAIEQVQAILLSLSAESAPWYGTLQRLEESLGDVLAVTAQRDEARVAYEDALRNAPSGDGVRHARLCRKLGKTWEAQHRHAEALAAYSRAEAVLPADAPQDEAARDEWIQLRIDQLWAHYWVNRLPEMEVVRSALEPVVRARATPSQRARFFHARALLSFRQDRYAVAPATLALAEQAVAACTEGPGLPELPMVQFLHGFVLLFHDSIEAAEAELIKAFEQAHRAGDTAQQARCLTYVALATRRRGAVRETAEHAATCRQVAESSNMREYLAAAWANEAWVALQRGAPAAARHGAEQAWETWRALSAVFPFCWMALLPLLVVELGAGALDRAVHCAEAMLAPDQHALPAAGAAALARAIAAHGAGDAAGCVAALGAALRLFDAAGYR